MPILSGTYIKHLPTLRERQLGLRQAGVCAAREDDQQLYFRRVARSARHRGGGEGGAYQVPTAGRLARDGRGEDMILARRAEIYEWAGAGVGGVETGTGGLCGSLESVYSP